MVRVAQTTNHQMGALRTTIYIEVINNKGVRDNRRKTFVFLSHRRGLLLLGLGLSIFEINSMLWGFALK